MVHFLLTPRTLVLEWKVMFLPASYHRQLVIQHQVWVSARQLNRPMGIPSREMRGIKLLGEIILCFSNMVCIWRLPIPRSGAIIQIREMLPLNWQVWTFVVLEIPPPPKKSKFSFYGGFKRESNRTQETEMRFSVCRKNRSWSTPVSWEWGLWSNSWLRWFLGCEKIKLW